MTTGQKISEVAPSYLTYRATTADMSQSTVNNDRVAIALLIKACGDVQPRNITQTHIQALCTLLAEGKAVSTYNTRLAGIRSFFRWCRAMGYTSADPLALVRIKKDRAPERHRVPVTDFPTLLNSAVHPRDRVLVMLGLWTFSRGSELRHLRIKDADLENGELYIYRQKTNDYDILPITKFMDTELRRWLTWYTEAHGPLQPDWYLLPSKQMVFAGGPRGVGGQFAKDNTLRLRPERPVARPEFVVQEVLSSCGYGTFREGVHTLRRSGARAYFDELCESGFDGALKRVSSMLGHADTRVTERYLGIREDRHSRNKALKWQVMFSTIEKSHDNVTQLRAAE